MSQNSRSQCQWQLLQPCRFPARDMRFLLTHVSRQYPSLAFMSRRVAARCNLFTSKSVPALNTDSRVYIKRERERNELTRSPVPTASRCTYVHRESRRWHMNESFATTVAGRTVYCRATKFTRCTTQSGDTDGRTDGTRRSTISNRYVDRGRRVEPNNRIIRIEGFARTREAYYTGRPVCIPLFINVESICH